MKTEAKRAHNASITEKDPRWALVVARGTQVDDSFYYSVLTTGVYCRPSCSAHLARPEHVQFHITCAEAEEAGFRPCKRCQPNQPSLTQQHAAIVADACCLIAESEEAPDLEALAHHAGMSRYHFHRIFKTTTGLASGVVNISTLRIHYLAIITDVRTALYTRLAPIANGWNASLRSAIQYPDKHADFLACCHAAEQCKPTPLLLQYTVGDYNCLHQDLYGGHVFPIQITILLSALGSDTQWISSFMMPSRKKNVSVM